MFSIVHPANADLRQQRNRLLQSCLRQAQDPDISPEYPLVLHADQSHLSYVIVCPSPGLAEGTARQQVVAHLNVWPTRVLTEEGARHVEVVLIGNVCTDPRYRGQGMMKALLERVYLDYPQAQFAILWSEQEELYHKLGFQSSCKEWRFTFAREPLTKLLPGTAPKITLKKAIDCDVQELKALRFPIPVTIDRTLGDWRSLCTIPMMYCAERRLGNQLSAFAMIGKGVDLQGVVHEWGATDPAALLQTLLGLMQRASWEQVTLLGPSALPQVWRESLQPFAQSVELATMALIKPLKGHNLQQLEGLFIWGPDSI